MENDLHPTERQILREQEVDKRFEKIEKQLELQPTKAELEAMFSGVAKQEDIEKFNGYVKKFILGIEILGQSSKWLLYAIITIGGIAGGVLVIKNGLFAAAAWLISFKS